MKTYPDNVIQFPQRKQDVPKRDIDSLPADIIPFLKGKPRESPLAQRREATPSYINKYITFEHLKKLDFPIVDADGLYEDSEILDRYLTALSSEFGDEATKKLAHVIGEYLAVVADVAFAEGLAESALPDHDEIDF